MTVKFDPFNPIIQLCISGMQFEAKGEVELARQQFDKAWAEAADDYEKFIAAYHISRLQLDIEETVKWLNRSLACAQTYDDDNVISAYPAIYLALADCYDAMSDPMNATKCRGLASQYKGAPTDLGPFYHGTKADLAVGDLLYAGGVSNYQADLKMNHIYFTANINGAGLAAALAKGEGNERIYRVEPTGDFEDDPNVTDKKFPGNLTRSYRSFEPLRIVGEVSDWLQLSPTEKLKWKEDIEKNKGEIIN